MWHMIIVIEKLSWVLFGVREKVGEAALCDREDPGKW